MLKLLTYTSLLFADKSKIFFRNARDRRNLKGLIEIHHIIPRQLKKHPTIIYSDYEIENGYNFMFLPTYKGAQVLNLHEDRPIHANGHMNYNSYVAITLDKMFADGRTSEADLCEFNLFLRENMRHLDIPW